MGESTSGTRQDASEASGDNESMRRSWPKVEDGGDVVPNDRG